MGVVRVPAADQRRYRVAIGLIVAVAGRNGTGGLELDTTEDASARRVSMAVAAVEAGYVLLDVIEATTTARITTGDWTRLSRLAASTDADALFALGVDECEREASAHRRCARDYERLVETSETMIDIAMIDVMGNRLAGGTRWQHWRTMTGPEPTPETT